jgi:secreted PhoX family phosphatase
MTCTFRCGNACDRPEPNTSGNEHFGDVLAGVIERRTVLKAGAAGGAGLVLGGVAAPAPAAAHHPHGGGRPGDLGRLDFAPVAPNVRDNVIVPNGFRYDVIIRWGDPVVKGAPAFDVHNQSAASQALQFGYNCDYLSVLPLGHRRALLVVNHEFTNEILMFPTGEYTTARIKEVAIQAHGLSVVEIERSGRDGSWRQVPVRRARRNRRLTMTSEFEVTGPAAGADRLKTSADPSGRLVLGTLNNCAGGTTPWGTTLHGEENFNFYFDSSTPALDPRYTTSYARYGILADPNAVNRRGWKEVDPRFDLSMEPHEPFRFGWIVELDPYDPESTPRKHTMLGRAKHEGATINVSADGRVAAYMGDDERGDYMYKFVSRDRIDRRHGKRAHRHNLTLLDHGTLYVAKFTGDGTADGVYDGTGTWIPLATDTESLVSGMELVDVLIDKRIAADKVGATRMDRPEDVELNPVNQKIYAALSNNFNRGIAYPVDEANPLASSMTRATLSAPLVSSTGNRNGYVLELTEDGDDAAAETFTWNLFLVCGDPEAPETYFAGLPKADISPISCPDNVAFDSIGNLWVATDGNALGSNDGLFAVPVDGPDRGRVKQFLTVPIGAETCGPLIVNDKSVFVAVQHPGEVDGASFENPSSTWPHTDDFARPSVVVAYSYRS